jgi:SPW repeat
METLSMSTNAIMAAEIPRPSPATWITLILGLLLALSPWILGFGSAAEELANATVDGLLIALCSLLALRLYGRWRDRWVNLVLLNVVLGVEAMIAPGLLKFSDVAVWSHEIIGIAVIALAVIETWRVTGPDASMSDDSRMRGDQMV